MLPWVVAAALAGLGIFAFLVWRSVTVEKARPQDASIRFATVRGRFAEVEPIIQLDAVGAVRRREMPSDGDVTHPTRLRVLAYRIAEQRLIRADVPFWFLKTKGPALKYTLHGTGLDLERLGVTPTDLERYGVCLVLDETRANGDRLLVWTE